MTCRTRSRGFSLVEMVATLTVFAVLLALAVPVFSDFMKRNAVATQTNELLGALRLARSTAVTRGIYVSMCPSATVTATSPTCASGTSVYNTGWLIYTSKSIGAVFASGDEILQVNQAISNASVQGDKSVVTFDSRGASVTGTPQFWVCAKSGSDSIGRSSPRYAGRKVDVQSGGRAGSSALATSTNATTAQGNCKAP